jgi:hypothetical protein
MNKAAAVCVCLALFRAPCLFPRERTVAITVDDLPYAGGDLASGGAAAEAAMVNRKLLAAFRAARVPAAGFVIQRGVESLGPAGGRILRRRQPG